MLWTPLSAAIAGRIISGTPLTESNVFVDAPPTNITTPFVLITALPQRENHKYGNSQVIQMNFDVTIFTPIDTSTAWSGHQATQSLILGLIRRHQFTISGWDISLINFIQATPNRVTKDVLQTGMEFSVVAEDK